MPRILVNGVEQPADSGRQQWGEVLEALDRQAGHAGLVLTAVRFDGVDQPSFRDPALASKPLQAVGSIEAESARPAVLLRNTVDEAISAARTLAAGAERVGGAFRGFDVSTATQELVEMARGLGTLVAIGQALGQALGVSLESVSYDGRTGRQMIEDLTSQADSLINAQRDGDWITVADVIEYDIAPSLQQWPGLFEVLGRSIPN